MWKFCVRRILLKSVEKIQISLKSDAGESGGKMCALCGECCLHSYNRTDNYRQWKAVGSPDDGHKDARSMLRYYWLPINHYLLHLVDLTFTYLSKMHGHSNIKFPILGRPSGRMVIVRTQLPFITRTPAPTAGCRNTVGWNLEIYTTPVKGFSFFSTTKWNVTHLKSLFTVPFRSDATQMQECVTPLPTGRTVHFL
jgi:hypothetical protein